MKRARITKFNAVTYENKQDGSEETSSNKQRNFSSLLNHAVFDLVSSSFPTSGRLDLRQNIHR